MRITRIAATVMLIAGLGGCASNTGPKETVGTLGGAALGGLLGSQIGKGAGNVAATAMGVFIGGVIGNSIGASMDKTDRLYAERASQQVYTAPIGQQIAWNNPNSGNSGTIVATRDGTNPDGRYCREFTQTITVGGKREQAYGNACRQPDGSWQIVNN